MSKLFFEYSLVVSEKKETSLVEPAAVLIHNTHEASLTNNGATRVICMRNLHITAAAAAVVMLLQHKAAILFLMESFLHV